MGTFCFLVAASAVGLVASLPTFTPGRDLGIRARAQRISSPPSLSMLGATPPVTNLTGPNVDYYNYSPPGDPSITVKFDDFRPREAIAHRQVQGVVNDIRHVAKTEYQAEGLGPDSPVDDQFFSFEWRYGKQKVIFCMGGATGPPPDTRGILYGDLTGVLMDAVERYWAWHGSGHDLPGARVWLWASRMSVLAGQGELYAEPVKEGAVNAIPVGLQVT